MFQNLQLHLMGQGWACKSFQPMQPLERRYSTSNLKGALAYQKSSVWSAKSRKELDKHFLTVKIVNQGLECGRLSITNKS